MKADQTNGFKFKINKDQVSNSLYTETKKN